MDVAERSVVITGAGSGIGRALARRMAADGARVAVADRDADGARRTVDDIVTAGGRAIAVECDVRDEPQVQHLVETATDAHGPVEVLCSNAGVAIGGGPDVDDAAWARAWETNVLAHVYGVRAVLRKYGIAPRR